MIPLRLRVHEPRGWLEWLVTSIWRTTSDLTPTEAETLQLRLAPFLSDSESGEVVVFTFDKDPERREYRLEDSSGEPSQTDLNGLAEGVLTLSADRARELLRAQDSEDGWLAFRATSAGHTGRGTIQLLDPTGLSVISDIDDTVRITEIPAGARAVMWNTFVAEFRPVPGMAERLQGWADQDGSVAFHYLSAGPWQLQPALADFLFDEDPGLPKGTFHMRDLRKNPFSPATWDDLYSQTFEAGAIYHYKVTEISEIVERFPGREFILVGDSGQKDPEIYRTIQERFPSQVREIVIRDVVDALETDPERLQGMTVVPGAF